MPVKKGKSHKKIIGTLIIFIAAISVLFAIILRENEKKVPVIKGKIEKTSEPGKIKPASNRAPEKTQALSAKNIVKKTQIPLGTEPIIVPMNTIDYNKIKKDREIRALMQKRKKRFGLDKGVDIIIKSNESIKVGTITVPMKEILDKIRLKKGDLITEDLMLKPLPKISRHESKEISEKLKTIKTRYTELEKALEHKRDRSKDEGPKTEDLLHKEITPL